MKKDPNYLEKIQTAIAEKYGEETIQSLRANWTRVKELSYLKQIRKISKRQIAEASPEDKVEVEGVLLPKKLFIKETDRVCSSCGVYSFNNKDDLFMTKFRCCFECWIKNIQGREHKWQNKLNEKE